MLEDYAAFFNGTAVIQASILVPDYINDLLIKTSEVHTRNLQSNEDAQLRVPKSRNNMYGNSFAVSAA